MAFSHSWSLLGVNISHDGLKAVAAYGDGTLHWYRLKDGRELFGAFLLPDQNQWTIWTQGYFDASEGAMSLLDGISTRERIVQLNFIRLPVFLRNSIVLILFNKS